MDLERYGAFWRDYHTRILEGMSFEFLDIDSAFGKDLIISLGIELFAVQHPGLYKDCPLRVVYIYQNVLCGLLFVGGIRDHAADNQIMVLVQRSLGGRDL
jgi:hypothetical protein